MPYSESATVKSLLGMIDAICAKLQIYTDPSGPAGSATAQIRVEYWRQNDYGGTAKQTGWLKVTGTASSGVFTSSNSPDPITPFVIDPAVVSPFKIYVTTALDKSKPNQIELKVSIELRGPVSAPAKVSKTIGIKAAVTTSP